MTGKNRILVGDAIRDQAIAWLVLVDSDAATAADWAALTRWLEASPANLAAFEAVELLSSDIADAASTVLASSTHPSAEIVPFPFAAPLGGRVGNAGRPTSGRGRDIWRVAIAASITAVVGTLGFGVWRASEGPVRVYRTAVGETRAVTLADGSHVSLDAASTMSVRLGWFTRKVQLTDAEATFDVAKNPSRPFEITVGDQRVRVVGTEFNVDGYGGVVDVTVRRGVVAVYQPDLGEKPIAQLTPGWSLRHKVGEAASFRRHVDPDEAFAWTHGRLICDDQPVTEIVAYLNRRYAQPIRLPASAQSRRFTGVLVLDDQQDVVRRLAAYLALSVHGSGQEIVLN